MSRELLKPLEELQTIDLKIEDLETRAAESPARLAELEGLVNQARAAADLERARLAENERGRRYQENLLREDREKVKKWEERLPLLKAPREFAALQREVEAAKRINTEAEEELNRLKSEAVEIKETLNAKEAELKAREEELAKEAPSLRNAERRLRRQVRALDNDREQHRQEADSRLLRIYDQIRSRRQGKALVETIDMCCTGCHRKMAPHFAYRLIAGAVDQCPSCKRLTYIKDDPPPEEDESAAS